MLSRPPLLLVLVSAQALVAPKSHCYPVSPTVYLKDVPLRTTSGRARVALAASTDEPQNPVAQDAPIYALAAALQAVPLVAQSKESHYVFFLGLATATVYLSSRAPSLAPPEAEPLTMKQAALAPVLASISLFSLYALIKYLSIDPSLGYRLLTSAFAGGASSLVLYEACDAVSDEDDRAPLIGGVIAFILVALYLGSDALQLSLEAKTGIANFLGWSLALLAPRTVPLRSFGVGAALLGGLFLYDIFFVFGSDVMMTVATKIDAPVVLKAPNPHCLGVRSRRRRSPVFPAQARRRHTVRLIGPRRRRTPVAARVVSRALRRREGRTRVAPDRDERLRRGPPSRVRGERILEGGPAGVIVPRAGDRRRGALHGPRDGRATSGRRATGLQGARAQVFETVAVTACCWGTKLSCLTELYAATNSSGTSHPRVAPSSLAC